MNINNSYITAVIKKIEVESYRVKNFTFDISIDALPGQYIMLWIPRLNEKPFGVVSPDPLIISVARVGEFTEAVHKLEQGDKVTFRGPYGSAYSLRGERLLLVGGGYGVVPLYFLAYSMSKEQRSQTTVVIGTRTETDLVFRDRFKRLGCRVEVSTDDGSAGFSGFSTDLVSKLLLSENFDSVYTCGPDIMMKKVFAICKEKDISCQVSAERYFKCGGIGLCGECSIGGKLACKDGPVFDGVYIYS